MLLQQKPLRCNVPLPKEVIVPDKLAEAEVTLVTAPVFTTGRVTDFVWKLLTTPYDSPA